MKEHSAYYTRLSLAFGDLSECGNYGKLLIKNSPEGLGSEKRTIYDALLISFFISYGRALKPSNAAKKNLTPIIKKRFKNFIDHKKNQLSAEQQKLHNFAITHRDKIFAHADVDALGLSMFKSFDGSYVHVGDNITMQYSNEIIEQVLEVCDYFISEILKEKILIEEKYSETFNEI